MDRAAVFTSQPQDVEVYSGGAWLPGSMLGWRHDATGGCQVWVRLTHGADEIWTDLECLRLPERHLSLAPEPGGGTVSGAVRAEALERTITRGLPAIREAGALSGRAAHPAGRRRAPETDEVPAVVVGLAAVPSGRHRAPAAAAMAEDAGRHRAADTGVWPAVADPAATAEMPRARVDARHDDTLPGRRQGVAGTGLRAPRPDLLTRPMRLTDAVPQPRSGRLDDSLGGF
jgi:hypothetical protein